MSNLEQKCGKVLVFQICSRYQDASFFHTKTMIVVWLSKTFHYDLGIFWYKNRPFIQMFIMATHVHGYQFENIVFAWQFTILFSKEWFCASAMEIFPHLMYTLLTSYITSWTLQVIWKFLIPLENTLYIDRPGKALNNVSNGRVVSVPLQKI